jgi:hypothetical protein
MKLKLNSLLEKVVYIIVVSHGMCGHIDRLWTDL